MSFCHFRSKRHLRNSIAGRWDPKDAFTTRQIEIKWFTRKEVQAPRVEAELLNDEQCVIDARWGPVLIILDRVYDYTKTSLIDRVTLILCSVVCVALSWYPS